MDYYQKSIFDELEKEITVFMQAEKLYEDGKYQEAAQIYRECVIPKGAEKLYNWGVAFYKGNSDVKNIELAIQYLKKAADLDYASAYRALAIIYMNRDECVDLNYELSFEYAEKAVELGEVSANYIIGYLYYYGYYVKKDYAKALEYFSKVKNCQNDDTALYILGMMHYYGQGCDVDYDFSFYYLTSYFEMERDDSSNDGNAYKLLGLMYLRGCGTKCNLAKAYEYLTKSEQIEEDDEVEFGLGIIEFVLHGPEAATIANKWFEKSAEKGNSNAQKCIKSAEEKSIFIAKFVRLGNGINTVELDSGYTIKYSISNGKAVIQDIALKYKVSFKSGSVLAVPEQVDGYFIKEIKPDALNNLRESNCKSIIVPNGVNLIGTKKDGLYPSFDNTSKKYNTISIFWAKYSYKVYSDFKIFNDALSVHKDDIFFINVTHSELKQAGFILLRKFQNRNGFWMYPQDGLWVLNNVLTIYTGDSNDLFIDNCERVASKVFLGDTVKNITFGENVTFFEKQMISNCPCLKTVSFNTDNLCDFESYIIQDCINLNSVNWPEKFNYQHLSLYKNCPELGNMIYRDCLMTFQNKDRVVTIPSEVKVVNKGAFQTCKSTKIVIIPESVLEVENDAFADSDICIVILEGENTRLFSDCSKIGRELYVYAKENSYFKNNLSPFFRDRRLYVKNINQIIDFLSPANYRKIFNTCLYNMDKKSDDEMIIKPYGWNKEIYYKD